MDIFYDEVIHDEFLAPFFQHMDMDGQQNNMVSFMTWAFGGPDEYKARDLRTAHQGLVKNMGLTDRHFDAVAVHLQNTLQELDVDEGLIERVISLVASSRDEALNK